MKVTSTEKKHKKDKKKPAMTASALLAQAEELLHTGRPDEALPLAKKALGILQPSPHNRSTSALPALTLLAEISLELGSPESARLHFLAAVELDPNGSIPESESGGAEKFLWLAQLSDEGGQDSVNWFEKGAEVLRRNIMGMVGGDEDGEANDAVEGMMKRLASALCGIVEIYMTDLSWESDAEATCERLITEALLTAPTSPEPLQTLASIRISQSRIPEAQKALADSMSLWKDLPPSDPTTPDFPTRISLARLLMEVEMEEDALSVVERLVSEDDQSVEAWYLGGWCLYLLGLKRRNERNGTLHDDDDDDDAEEGKEREDVYTASLVSSREWLGQSLKLYEMLEYEDGRLRDHALELVEGLDGELEGRDVDVDVDGAEEGEGESEEDEGEDEDEEMDGT